MYTSMLGRLWTFLSSGGVCSNEGFSLNEVYNRTRCPPNEIDVSSKEVSVGTWCHLQSFYCSFLMSRTKSVAFLFTSI